jgi:hypothetical protein
MKDGTVISGEIGTVYDLLAFKKLNIQVYVKVAANSGRTLQLQHSAVDDEDTFMDLGSSLDIATTGSKEVDMDDYLRYVRIKASSGITTQPTLSIFLIAKEN